MSMYKPEPRILKYLREYDPDLGARWDSDISRWRLTWRGKDVLLVENPDGSYRPLDERAITKARLSDAWAHRSGAAFCRMLEEEKHRLDEADKRRLLDEFSQQMKEDGYRAMFGGPMIQGWRAEA